MKCFFLVEILYTGRKYGYLMLADKNIIGSYCFVMTKPISQEVGIIPLQVNGTRLWDNIMKLGQIGVANEKGVSRIALSDSHMEAKRWLIEQMKEAGLEVRIDPVANVIGTLRMLNKVEKRQVLCLGSHLDTVPNGGMFDGAYGVLAALECARTIAGNNIELPWDLEVIDFTDEEGYFCSGMELGSRAMLGTLPEEEIFVNRVPSRPSFAEALERIGMPSGAVKDAVRDISKIRAYLEAHVEQGGRLENDRIEAAAVTGIVGIHRYLIRVFGEANHGGTTPMNLRNDALVKAAPLFQLLPEWIKARSKTVVGTIGKLDLLPGTVNVVPGECRFTVELRSIVDEEMYSIRELLTQWANNNPKTTIQVISEKKSVLMDSRLISIIERAAAYESIDICQMPSGAGHDAQSFAPYVPTGMIFVPSRGGISHNAEEWSSPKSCDDGCQLLLRTILILAQHDSNNLL